MPPEKDAWFSTEMIDLPIVKGVYWVEVLIEMVPFDGYVAELQNFKAEGCLHGEINSSVCS